MNLKTEQLWDFIWDSFFFDKTNLIYDFRIHNGKNGCTDDLPTPYEVSKSFPNPSGYGTGMEDSVLNGGAFLEAVIAKYEVTHDESLRKQCQKLVKGLLLCSSVSCEKGFVARSVLPTDCKSYYINSSRDQYTHWIYGLYRAYFSDLCTDELRSEIKLRMKEVASKFERDIIPQNNYTIIRADGTLSETNQMWGKEILPHEALRLPMFYLAAYKVTGEQKWYELYRKYVYDAIEISKRLKPGACAAYAYLQMQYSQRLIYEADDDIAVKNIMKELMYMTFDCVKDVAPNHAKGQPAPEYAKKLCAKNTPWRTRKLTYTYEEPKNGYFWCNPGLDPDFKNEAFYPIREVGECLIVAALCPDRLPDNDQIDALKNMILAVDPQNHYSSAPLLMLDAYWLIRKLGITL